VCVCVCVCVCVYRTDHLMQEVPTHVVAQIVCVSVVVVGVVYVCLFCMHSLCMLAHILVYSAVAVQLRRVAVLRHLLEP
jgi:hypothetical protein